MIDLFTKFVLSDYYEPIFFFVIVGIPVLALLVYNLQPEWYKQEQNRIYVKLTIPIFIIAIVVVILKKLGII